MSEEKDAKLSFHGARCDIRSFFPLVTLSLQWDPPSSGCSSLRDGAHLVVKMQVQGPGAPCASPSLSSAVSRASPDLSKISSTQPCQLFPWGSSAHSPFLPPGRAFHIYPHLPFPLSQESGFWIAFQRIHIIKLPFLILTSWYKEILPTSRGAMYLLKRFIF